MFLNHKKNILLLSCLVMLLILSYFCYQNSPPNTFPETIYGMPVIATNYEKLNISIEQVIQDDTYIYTMLHHSNGVVQVYNFDGKYQFSIFFYCHGKGGFNLAIADNILYVQDMRANVYVFERGEFREFVKAVDAKRRFSELDFKVQKISEGYEIESDCVWRIEDGKRVCFIGEPRKANIDKNNVAIICTFFLMLVGLVHMKKK